MTDFPYLNSISSFDCAEAKFVFNRRFKLQSELVESLWQDTIQWLWLGRYHQSDSSPKPRSLRIFPALIPVDEMWHAFILCTRRYHDFCRIHFGDYLHHEPVTENHGDVGPDDLAWQFEYVMSKLGRQYAFRTHIESLLTYEGVIAQCSGGP